MSKDSLPNQDPFAEREALRYERPIASREYLLQIIQADRGPCTFESLLHTLQLSAPEDEQALQRRLTAMVRDGQLVLNRREGYLPVNERDLVRGRIIAHADGFGFLHPDEGHEDLYIPAKQMRALLHGDRAIMRITGIDRRGRKEAALVEVLERANQRVVGRLFAEGSVAFVVPENKRLCQDIIIPKEGIGQAVVGQIVVAAIVEQPTYHHPPIGHIESILGEHMDPGMEIEMAIVNFDIPDHWSEEVLGEAKALGDSVKESDKAGRLDLRDKPLVTIDGEDARDFDDAVFCEPMKKGWRLYVAIADVSHYVLMDSALDEEAYRRGTSVYFPERVVPMLPESLSNGLCSLNPGVDRLCMVCILDIDRSGNIRNSQFEQAVMRSHARLSYTQVAAALVERVVAERKKINDVLPYLEDLFELYKVLLQKRNRRGAIEFDTTETRIEFGDERKIESIVPVVRNDAHRLIEECMIAANIAAAEFLQANNIAALYRVHESPPADKLDDLASFLGELGIKFARRKITTPKHLASVINLIKGRPDEHMIQTVLLRSLSQAQYQPDNEGHFGLALETYTHFTSPIRRYPDLLVHRAIRHIITGRAAEAFPYTHNKVLTIGEHSSMTERRADEATRDAIEWLKCEYLLDKVGSEHDGIITGVTAFGVFVELQGIYVEGLAHVTSLPKDYYHFDPVTHKLSGERSGRVFQLGNKVRVQISRVSLDDREVDLDIVESPARKRRR